MGGDRDDGVKAVPFLVVGGDDRQQLRRLHSIDFVDAEDAGNFFLLHPLNQRFFRAAHMGNRLHQQQRAVYIRKAGGDHLHHVVAQRGLRPVQARRIQQNELRIVPVDDAVNAVAGGLGLVGDNSYLLPHQGVGQAGLAHIRPAADGDHSGFRNV